MKVRDAISRMGFYEPPLGARKNGDQLLLDFNESTIPPPAEALEAMTRFIQSGKVKEYPDYRPVISKLADYAGVRTDQVIVTNGSDQAIDIILRALLNEGDEMIFPRPGFSMFPHIADSLGAVTVETRYREDMSFPFEETIAAVGPKTRLIVLVTPNNPTGTVIPPEQIRAILEQFPEIPVLVDEAYYEFTGSTSTDLIDSHDNLVVIRTFSKAFALAGLRFGYAMSNPGFIRELHKVRGPFDVNMMAVRGVEAILDHLEPVRAYIREVMDNAKPMVERFFREHGVTFFPSGGNFLLVQPDDLDSAYQFLLKRDVLVRCQGAPIPNMFRLSIGTTGDMKRFVQTYAEYLESRG